MASARQTMDLAERLWRYIGLPMPRIEFVAAAAMPPAFRALLDHSGGMTLALERRWAEAVRIELLADDLALSEHALFRYVVLRTRHGGLAVEVAAIRILMGPFPCALRTAIIEGITPFGRLLTEAGISYQARPQAFLSLAADGFIAAKAGIHEGVPVFGRINHLVGDDGDLLCETIELLPRA